MMLDTLQGNEQCVAKLKTALLDKTLMHAVLICGAQGMGAGYAGKCLAADYLYGDDDNNPGKKAVMAGQSAEYIVLQPEGAAGDIKIDAIRNTRKNIHSTALSSNARVVHIKHAHKLNAFGANALLKVLEEPPQNVLFILSAPGVGTIMQTIRSRCAIYQLSGVDTLQCEQYLLKNYAKTKNIKTLAGEYSQIFEGKIGTCIYVLSGKEGEKAMQNAKAVFLAVHAKNSYDTAAILAQYEKDKPAAKNFLRILADYCAFCLRNASNDENDKRKTAAKIIENVHETRLKLSQNANAKLCYTAMVIGLLQP